LFFLRKTETVLDQVLEKPQVPMISRRLGAFCSPGRLRGKRKSNKYVHFPIYLWLFTLVRRRIRSVHRIFEFLKSPKSPRFHGNLWLFALQDISAESGKATSIAVFLYTWGFSSMSEEEFVESPHLRIPQKQQVPVISWELVAFRSPGRLCRKRKSNKYSCFSIYLGLFVHVRGRKRKSNKSVHFPMYLGLFVHVTRKIR